MDLCTTDNACTSAGAYWWSNNICNSTPETVSPPTGLNASDGTYTDKVVISWGSISGADSYKVYRSPQVNGQLTLLQSTSSTPYDDTTGTSGITYYYWVKAVVNSNASDFSLYDTGYKAL